MLKVLTILFVLTALYLTYIILRCAYSLTTYYQIAQHTQPFQRLNPEANIKILVLGDSTAYGTGSDKPEDSIAGRLGKKYPKSEIINFSINGMTADKLLAKDWPEGKYDLISLHLGGNDITQFRSVEKLDTEFKQIFQKLTQKSPHIIWFSAGNVGGSGLFAQLWPLDKIYHHQSKKVRTLFQNLAQKYPQVHYIDLYAEPDQDLFRKNKSWLARDQFHPSSKGYANWFERMEKIIAEKQILP